MVYFFFAVNSWYKIAKMNIFAITNDANLTLNAAEGYVWLTIAIPVMIALLVIMMFKMMVGIFSVSDHLGSIRRMLSDVFAERLDALDEADRIIIESEREARAVAREARIKVIKPMTKNQRILLTALIVSIPVLLIILIILNLSVR